MSKLHESMKPAEKILKKADLTQTFWGQRIVHAEIRGHFLRDDRMKAMGWQTCACGRQSALIPRRGGQPLDALLATLGGEFYTRVRQDEFVSSARTLVEIEAKAAKITHMSVEKYKRRGDLKYREEAKQLGLTAADLRAL